MDDIVDDADRMGLQGIHDDATAESAQVVLTQEDRRGIIHDVTVRLPRHDWDVNCPQHIPRLLSEEEVTQRVAPLTARIAELEAELASRSNTTNHGKD